MYPYWIKHVSNIVGNLWSRAISQHSIDVDSSLHWLADDVRWIPNNNGHSPTNRCSRFLCFKLRMILKFHKWTNHINKTNDQNIDLYFSLVHPDHPWNCLLGNFIVSIFIGFLSCTNGHCCWLVEIPTTVGDRYLDSCEFPNTSISKEY